MKEMCSEIQRNGAKCPKPAKFAVTRYGKTQCYCGIHTRAYRIGRWLSVSDIRPLTQPAEQPK